MDNIVFHISMQKNYGGGEKQIFLLLNKLKNNKSIKNILICPLNSIIYDQCIEKKIKVKTFKNFSLYNISSYLWILKNIKNNNIIHAHDGKAAAFACFIKILSNIIYEKNIYVIIHRRINILINSYLKKLKYNYANKIIAISKTVKNSLIKSKIKNNILVIYSCINETKENINIKEKFKLPINDKIIISATRFEKDKGIYDILEVAKKICSIKNNISFVIFGTGSEKNKIDNIIKNNKLEKRIILTGFVENVEKYFSSAYIYLSCSYNEGLGTSVLNAIKLNIPVIAYRTGGISETIKNNVNGFLVENKNIDKITEKILFLLNNNDLYKKIKENCYLNPKFSVEKMVNEHLRIYKRMK